MHPGHVFALEHGADIWEYHERMFKAAAKDRLDIADIDVLAAGVRGLLDADAFRKSLQSGEYVKALGDANDYAYEQSGVWAVPSYRFNGMKLDSIEGIGVTKDQLARFIETAKQV
jgi:Predicted dithiol-disulfide isomerase involved in polyketide biosynthesis